VARIAVNTFMTEFGLGAIPLIVIAAVITYATRFAGLSFGDRDIPPVAQRFLHYVPIAAFSALVAPGLGGRDDDLLPRVAAAAMATLVVIKVDRLWVCLAVGMAVFWLTRWVT
jgi:branched-subunit amino acid transport protein